MKSTQEVTETLQRMKSFYGQLKPYVMDEIPKNYRAKLIIEDLLDNRYELSQMEWADDTYVEYLHYKFEKLNQVVVSEYGDGLDCLESLNPNEPLTLERHKSLIDLTYNLCGMIQTLEELLAVYDARQSGEVPTYECD